MAAPVNKKKYHAKKGSKPSNPGGGKCRPSRNGGASGGGGGPRKKQYSSNKKFPLTTKRRGGPGMLLTCEAGREVQCCREGLLILQHYYEQEQMDKSDATSNGKAAAAAAAAAPETKTLTMDEEIALLQQQGSATASLSATANAPFAMYETGCRGTVFLICTLPGCALIPLSLLLQQRTLNAKRDHQEDDEEASQPPNDEDSANDEKDEDDDGKEDDSNVAKKAEHETPKLDSTKKRSVDSNDAAQNASKKRKATVDDDNNGTEIALKEQTTLTATSSSTPPPWDPVATIQSIIRDLSPATAAASSLSSDPPPSSRYVTRMIPMQATCYASVDEIAILGRALIQRYLQDASPPHTKGDSSQSPPQTFSIAIKRRICSNVTRDAIIDALATAVMNSGAPPPAGQKDAQSPLPPTTWKVDLKNPDMIVQVEICKTLCGISVLSGQEHRTLYRNFNLIEIRTQDQPPTASSSSTLPPSPSAST